EMAPESLQAVVMPKFDMHVYTSELTIKELKEAITEYCIPTNLHPHLLPPDLTMDKLPSKYIRLVPIRVNRVILFEISYRSLNIKATVSLFRVFYNLCKHGYWFLFENKTGGRLKKCFKEVTSSLKGWKKKFFLIDRRAVTDAMPWRNFPNNYNEGDAECLAEFIVPLRPPLCHLLYVCRLTTACRHLELSCTIKDPEGKDPNFVASSSVKETQSLKTSVPSLMLLCLCSESEGTFSITPIRLASPEHQHADTYLSKKNAKDTNAAGSRVKTPADDVVNLSNNTHPPTPHVHIFQNEDQGDHGDGQKNVVFFDAHSVHEDDNVETSTAHPFIPEWGLWDDLRICSYWACKELISHMATPTEEEFLSGLSNVELSDMLIRQELNRLRNDLQRDMQSNGGLTKQLTLLEIVHAGCSTKERELMDRLKDMEKERDDGRKTASEQVEKIKKLEEAIKPKSK
nr:hypothetical protein [Tanacetum cinerariifolium]